MTETIKNWGVHHSGNIINAAGLIKSLAKVLLAAFGLHLGTYILYMYMIGESVKYGQQLQMPNADTYYTFAYGVVNILLVASLLIMLFSKKSSEQKSKDLVKYLGTLLVSILLISGYNITFGALTLILLTALALFPLLALENIINHWVLDEYHNQTQYGKQIKLDQELKHIPTNRVIKEVYYDANFDRYIHRNYPIYRYGRVQAIALNGLGAPTVNCGAIDIKSDLLANEDTEYLESVLGAKFEGAEKLSEEELMDIFRENDPEDDVSEIPEALQLHLENSHRR